jgi:hypothetical protein
VRINQNTPPYFFFPFMASISSPRKSKTISFTADRKSLICYRTNDRSNILAREILVANMKVVMRNVHFDVRSRRDAAPAEKKVQKEQ